MRDTDSRFNPFPGLRSFEPEDAAVVPELTELVLGGHRIRLVVDRNATDQYTEWVRNGAGTESSSARPRLPARLGEARSRFPATGYRQVCGSWKGGSLWQDYS